MLIDNIGVLLAEARSKIAREVNTIMVDTYWNVGKYIVEYEQQGKERAEYGSNLLNRLSKDLTERYGKGFSKSNLLYIRKFYLVFRKNSNTDLTTKSIVIRHPVYRKNCVDIKLCDKANGIVTKTITKSDKSNYKYVKKLSHGDTVNIDL